MDEKWGLTETVPTRGATSIYLYNIHRFFPPLSAPFVLLPRYAGGDVVRFVVEG